MDETTRLRQCHRTLAQNKKSEGKQEQVYTYFIPMTHL